MPYLNIFLTCLLWITVGATAASSAVFEPNRGQVLGDVEFFTRQGRGFVSFSGDAIRFSQPDAQDRMQQFSLRLAQASSRSKWAGAMATGAVTSYHTGKDASRWTDRVPHYQRIERKDVYPGIDVVFYFKNSKLEYDFVVHPGADLKQIRLVASEPLESAQSVLSAGFASGKWVQRAPVIYQDTVGGRRMVGGGVVRCGALEYCFEARDFDRSRDLIVDPVLEFSSYLAGEGEDEIQVLGSGAVAGTTTSVALLNAPAGTRRQRDIFVRLADPKTSTGYALDGSTVVLGGSGDESLSGYSPMSLATGIFPASADFIVSGTTNSPDLFPNAPATPFAGGETDGFVMSIRLQFNPFGLALIGMQVSGTYVGGSGADRIHGMSLRNGMVFVVGETTSVDLPVVKATQESSGGKLDGFIASYPVNGPYVSSYLSYWGGDGDDRLTAVTFSNRPGAVHVAGQTDSSHLPGLEGAPDGPTDAFLLEYRPVRVVVVNESFEPEIFGLRRVGGNGTDRIAALANTGAAVYFGGFTTSTNLAVRDALQSDPGGGEDGFLGMIAEGEPDVTMLTYVGGSGDDQVLSIAGEGMDVVGFGGTTTSKDLKTFQAVQSRHGGGMDGFFGTLSKPTLLTQLSYFGGSGDDQVRAVQVFASGLVRVAGGTTSADLPMARPYLGVPSSARDAFVADISSDTIDVPLSALTAKHYSVSIAVRAPRMAAPAPLTIHVADPSVVSLSADGSTGELVMKPTGSSGEAIYVRLYGMADQGETTVTFDLPGIGSRTMRVYVGRIGFEVDSNVSLDTYSRVQMLRTRLVVQHPATGALQDAGALQWASLAEAPKVRYAVQDPTVLVIAMDNTGTVGTITPLRAGATDVSVSSDAAVFSPATFVLEVQAPRFAMPSSPIFVHRGEVKTLQLNTVVAAANRTVSLLRGRFRVESADAEVLEVALVASGAAPVYGSSAEYDSTASSGVLMNLYVRAKADRGETAVRITSSDLGEEFVLPISVRALVASFRLSEPPLESRQMVPPNYTFDLLPTIVYEGTGVSAAPLATMRLEVGSSRPEVVAPVSVAAANVTSRVRLQSLAEGKTRLSFAYAGTLPLRGEDFEIEAANGVPQLDSPTLLEVGTNLVAPATVRFRSAPFALVSVVSPDPALVRLVPIDANGRPVGEVVDRLSMRVQTNGTLVFGVVGQASSGTGILRAEFANSATVEIPVALRPSGVAFTTQYHARPFHSIGAQPLTLRTYMLDAQSLAPAAEQVVRPGLFVPVTVTTSPEGVTPQTHTCQINSATPNGCTFTPTVARPGRYRLSIGEIDGFTAARFRRHVDIEVRPSAVSILSVRAVRDAVTSTVVNIEGGASAATVTVKSLDPTKLLLSTNVTGAGQDLVTLRNAQTMYFQGLTDSGSTDVEISGAEIEPIVVKIFHSRLVAQVGSSTEMNGVLPTLLRGGTFQFNVNVCGEGGYVIQRLRPGVGPFPVTVENSNAAAVEITLSTNQFTGDNNRQIGVMLGGAREGEAEFSVVIGGLNKVGPFRTRTRLARLSIVPTLVGRSLPSVMSVNVESRGTGPTDNSLLTIRSLDPARLLLGRTATAAPAASITVAFGVYRTNSDSFYLFAQDRSGQVDLEFSMPGFTTSTSPVYLTGVYLNFTQPASSDRLVLRSGDSATTVVRFGPTPRPEVVNLPGFSFTSLSDSNLPALSIPVRIRNSNPDVLSVTPVPNLATANGRVSVHGFKVGSARISIEPPEGFDPPPATESPELLVVVN